MEKKIYIGAGCFWGAQKYFSYINGVIATRVGYANGSLSNPSYELVKSGVGHVECVEIIYDDSILNLSLLLEAYYAIIDPTLLNQQGGDVGVQYRTGIYYENNQDLVIINDSINALKEKVVPVQIEVCALENFYEAEGYHQNYLDKNADGYCHIGQCAFDNAKKINKL